MPSTDAPPATRVREVLSAAVEALGGEERPGQIQMAEAVARAMTSGEHLLVQAGTGTGKSLGYLVPALLHERRVDVADALHDRPGDEGRVAVHRVARARRVAGFDQLAPHRPPAVGPDHAP